MQVLLRRAARLAVLGSLLAAPVAAQAQGQGQGQTPQNRPQANPADVSTIDSIIPALYAVISGPVGAPRDWDRMQTLFHSQARLVPTGCGPNGQCGARVLTVDDYRQNADSVLRALGFREKEVARRTERYGNIAHVFSTYESYRGDETEPFDRGINSIQLLWNGSRWLIMHVFWDSERGGANPIPEQYKTGVR